MIPTKETRLPNRRQVKFAMSGRILEDINAVIERSNGEYGSLAHFCRVALIELLENERQKTKTPTS